jgi:hypothetical protein
MAAQNSSEVSERTARIEFADDGSRQSRAGVFRE